MPEDKVFPVDPVTLKLADGVTRELRYTNGSFKRLKKHLGVGTMREVLSQEFSEIAAALIFEGLVDKTGITEDQIDDLIPAHTLGDVQAIVIAAISGSSPDQIKNELRRQVEQAPPAAAS